MEPYAIALLTLLAAAVAAILFTVSMVVVVDRSVDRQERGTAGTATDGASGAEPDGNDAPGVRRAGGEG